MHLQPFWFKHGTWLARQAVPWRPAGKAEASPWVRLVGIGEFELEPQNAELRDSAMMRVGSVPNTDTDSTAASSSAPSRAVVEHEQYT